MKAKLVLQIRESVTSQMVKTQSRMGIRGRLINPFMSQDKGADESKALYSDKSIKRIIDNDSMRYEPSMQHMVDEFRELSCKAELLLTKVKR